MKKISEKICKKCQGTMFIYREVECGGGITSQQLVCFNCSTIIHGPLLESSVSNFIPLDQKIIEELDKTVLLTDYETKKEGYLIVLGWIRQNMWGCWIKYGEGLYRKFTPVESNKDPKVLLAELKLLINKKVVLKDDKSKKRCSI